jgi:ectoine hydroxylase-related dioxygenase (phytanoyl-CoA dioxygenase family)
MKNIVDEMNENGFSIIKNGISKNTLSLINEKLDSYFDLDHEIYGETFLKEINEFEHIRNLIEYDDLFLKLIDDDKTLDNAIQKLLHKYAIIHNYNLIRLTPNYKSNMLGHDWHRDIYFFGPGIRTAVNVIIPLQSVNEINGGTMVIPKSHLKEKIPNDEEINKNKFTPNLDLGDILLVDASCYHSAGVNKTDQTRTIIVLKYTLSFFSQQYDFCKSLPVENYSEKIKGRLGYYVRVPENVKEFRVIPENRKYKWPIRY